MDQSAIAALRPVCRLDEIPENGAKGVEIGGAEDGLDLVLLRRGTNVLGYVNSCPHQGTPLETFPGKFLDQTGEFLICSTHGARFRIGDGYCVWGPCAGKRLAPVRLRIESGMVWLDFDDAAADLPNRAGAGSPAA